MVMKFSRFPVFKISATGNDFLLVDLRKAPAARSWKSEWSKHPRSHWVKLWCHRQEGIGADGMVFLEKTRQADFAWDFYNSDGSSAEMCGNAARAVSLFVNETTKKKEFDFQTRVGIVEAKVKSASQIDVRLPRILEEKWEQSFSFKGTQMNFDFVRAGVPHAVVRVPSVYERAAMREIAHAVKALPQFLKNGVNVTFVRLLGKEKIESITFERGVEDFTLSCGTGAIASAYSVLRGEQNTEVEVQVPGGRLSVVWKNGSPHLKGPAKIVAELHMSKVARKK
jgi:diaminopimelate epimerase